jgi:MFS family permease
MRFWRWTGNPGAVGNFASTAVRLVGLGCCQILISTGCNTTLQLSTPDALRGRVMGLYALANAGMTPFGAFLIGVIADHFGVRIACALGGGGGLVALTVLVGRRRGVVWTSGRNRLRHFPPVRYKLKRPARRRDWPMN